MIKLVIFDCDGILIESELLQNRAYRQAFKEIVGFDLSEEEYAREVTCLGKTAVDYVDDFVEADKAEETKKAVRQRKNEIYNKLIDDELKIVPGVVELIKDIKGKVPIIVVSASSIESINKGLSKFNLQVYFDKIQSCIIDEVHHPKGEVLHDTIKEMGATPGTTVIIEDTPKGLKAAKAAGIKCIICKKSYSKDFDYSDADMIVNSLEELNTQRILDI